MSRPGPHALTQITWGIALLIPAARQLLALAHQPTIALALGYVELSGIWAAGASVVWLVRVAALSSFAPWGRSVRERARRGGVG